MIFIELSSSCKQRNGSVFRLDGNHQPVYRGCKRGEGANQWCTMNPSLSPLTPRHVQPPECPHIVVGVSTNTCFECVVWHRIIVRSENRRSRLIDIPRVVRAATFLQAQIYKHSWCRQVNIQMSPTSIYDFDETYSKIEG